MVLWNVLFIELGMKRILIQVHIVKAPNVLALSGADWCLVFREGGVASVGSLTMR